MAPRPTMHELADAFAKVRTIGLGLPNVEADTRYDGSPVLKMGGAFMAGMATHFSAEPDTLVVRAEFEDRDRLIEEAPATYYLTDHYRRHPVVLVRLAHVDRDALVDLLTTSWRLTRPKARISRVRAAASRGTRSLMTALLVVASAAASTLASDQTPASPTPPAAAPAVAPIGDLHLPPGFSITSFASDLQGARMMAVSPEGVLHVARRGDIVALPDSDRDGRAEPHVVLTGLTNAHTLAFRNGYLYVGTTPAVVRVKWVNGAAVGDPENFVELPTSTPAVHVSRSILFGPDGRLYVGIGSSCNVCIEGDPRRTTIQVFDADGKNGRTFAAGLHNAVGLDWDPRTGRLWATDTGQEQLGDDTPPDEIDLIEDGKHYGFPFFYGQSVESHVPEISAASHTMQAAQVVKPSLELPAHASPLGLTFYTGTRFPADYRTMFVTLHGSTARSEKNGYKVMRVVMKDGRPVSSDDFITGWLKDGVVVGRPRGIATGPDGALYISDDNKGFIYRVDYRR